MSEIPLDKGFVRPDVIHLNETDIDALSLKNHALQKWHLANYPGCNLDDCFGLPLPPIRTLDKVDLSYKSKSGMYKRGFAEGRYKLTKDDPLFCYHFLGDPVIPGSQGQDVIFQLAGIWSAFSGLVTGRPRALAGDFQFSGQILPSSTAIHYRIDVKRFYKKQRILHFSGAISLDGSEHNIYEFNDCKLGFFSKEDLGIKGRAKEYYKPNWDKIKEDNIKTIETAKAFYDGQ